MTRSPSEKRSAPGPRATTSPASSRPGMSGGEPGGAGYRPRRWSMSAPFRPAARTRTRISPAPGSGSGCSSTRTSPSRTVAARTRSGRLGLGLGGGELRPTGGRMLVCPGDDVLRVGDDLPVVGHEHRDSGLPGEALGLATTVGEVERVGEERQPVGLDDLRLVSRIAQRLVRVLARMPARARAREEAPADVELHARESAIRA